MGGTARVKRLGAIALLALLLAPAPAAASHERRASKEWVWGEWGDDKDRERRERRESERQERHERERARRADKKRERLADKRRHGGGKHQDRHYDRHRHHHHDHGHGHGGYGLVYRSHRDRPRHRPHHHYHPRPSYHRPRPHPCGPWMYNGRPYDPTGYGHDDEFWYWDDDWFSCGHHRPWFLRRDRRSSYVVHLTGGQADPPGPADASGAANLLLVRDHFGFRGRICYRLSLRGTDTSAPLQAHLHRGPPGQTVPDVFFDLDLPRNGREACRDASPALVHEIERRPGSFYLDVHTRTFDPVVRGQLARAYNS